jgi:uncharacterized protein RhaS with RHS repeats
MGVRLYDPATGRFLQPDPIEGGNANNYEYVMGDPINGYDLDGRHCQRLSGPGRRGVPVRRCLASRWVYAGSAVSSANDVVNFRLPGATSVRLAVRDFSANYGTIEVRANGGTRSRHLPAGGSVDLTFTPRFGQDGWRIGVVWEPGLFYQGKRGGLVTGLFTVDAYIKETYWQYQ